MRIRPATPRDADALAATVAAGFACYRSFAPPGWSPPDPLEVALGIAARLQEPSMRAWVAVDEKDAVAGQVAHLPATRARQPCADPAMAHLAQLFVRPERWGSGLATRLLALAVGDAARRGFTAMRLFTPAGHLRARRFYEREGWTVAGEPAFEPSLGLDVVEYRRRLP